MGDEVTSMKVFEVNGPEYVNVGSNKCTKHGKEPKYEFVEGASNCEAKCSQDKLCGGFNVGSTQNCLLWKDFGLAGDVYSPWGSSLTACMVKVPYANFGESTRLLKESDEAESLTPMTTD